MASTRIDLQSDPEVPAGRETMERLVGAHMAAETGDELLQFVRHSLEEVFSAPPEYGLRLLTHAAYRGQALIVALLDLATAQQIALAEAGIDPIAESRIGRTERFKADRLELWQRLRDDSLGL